MGRTNAISSGVSGKQYKLEKTDIKYNDSLEIVYKINKSGLFARVSGGYLQTSPDLKTWTSRVSFPSMKPPVETDEYVVIALSEKIAISTDGINFVVKSFSWSIINPLDILGDYFYYYGRDSRIYNYDLINYRNFSLDKAPKGVTATQPPIKKDGIYYYYGRYSNDGVFKSTTKDFKNWETTQLLGSYATQYQIDLTGIVDGLIGDTDEFIDFVDGYVNLLGYKGLIISYGKHKHNGSIIVVDTDLKPVAYVMMAGAPIKDNKPKITLSNDLNDSSKLFVSTVNTKVGSASYTPQNFSVISAETLVGKTPQVFNIFYNFNESFMDYQNFYSLDGILENSLVNADGYNLRIVEK